MALSKITLLVSVDIPSQRKTVVALGLGKLNALLLKRITQQYVV